ncbi:MAG: ASCH domain-containing protein [Burkholderiaceae bacterium]|nr:ASCH domain-containing protein [Burkholderiaceae bacterium]MBP7659876.1 ASCH domain-containing protein [Burkholderiaceae bacterium]
MNPRVTAYWRDYLASLAGDHAHRLATPEAFAFGDSPDLADELADLVVTGVKRATASLAIEFGSLGEPLPAAGDVCIVLRGDGLPVAIIERTEVLEQPFGTVDAAFAAREGEGDGSLASWRANHRDYFARVCERLGGTFDECTPVLCQRFEVIWRGDSVR